MYTMYKYEFNEFIKQIEKTYDDRITTLYSDKLTFSDCNVSMQKNKKKRYISFNINMEKCLEIDWISQNMHKTS